MRYCYHYKYNLAHSSKVDVNYWYGPIGFLTGGYCKVGLDLAHDSTKEHDEAQLRLRVE